MKKILQLETWKIFALVFLSFFSPHSFTGNILMVLWIGFITFYVYNLAHFLNKFLPAANQRNIRSFDIHLAIAAVYFIIISFTSTRLYILDHNGYSGFHMPTLLVLPTFFSYFSLFYCVFWIVKATAAIANGEVNTLRCFLDTVFFIAFLPIALFVVYPKLLIMLTQLENNAKSGGVNPTT